MAPFFQALEPPQNTGQFTMMLVAQRSSDDVAVLLKKGE
jgi:hypothetical protein